MNALTAGLIAALWLLGLALGLCAAACAGIATCAALRWLTSTRPAWWIKARISIHRNRQRTRWRPSWSPWPNPSTTKSDNESQRSSKPA